jgi:predicted nicotinamide N-methyase
VLADGLELVEEIVALPDRELRILRPPDPEALLDEEAFEHEEFLPYWAELWPSSLALADAVSRRAPARLRVLELGCGLAVPSLAAAAAGARVLATDWSPDAIDLVPKNAARNGVSLDAAVCTWSAPDELVRAGPWDLVLASDVLYERRNVDLLLGLLPRLVGASGEVLLADPGRPATASFRDAAARDWVVETTPDPKRPRVSLFRLVRRTG